MRRFRPSLVTVSLMISGAALASGTPALLRWVQAITTPNMSLVLPVPGVTPGPTWASQLVTALTAVDAHDHTTGKGHTVPVAGLNLNADLPMGGHAIKAVDHLELLPNLTVPDSEDANWIYEVSGNLYFSDGEGDLPIQLTDEDGLHLRSIDGNYQTDVAVPSLAYSTALAEYSHTTNGTTLAGSKVSRLKVGVLAVSSDYTITDTDQAAVLMVNSSVARAITLPSVTNSKGRLLLIKDQTGNAAAANITVSRAGSALIDGATSKIITTNYGVLRLVCDGANWGLL